MTRPRQYYKVTKRLEVAGSHRLNLPYDSPCQNLHGHNWIITITCVASDLTDYGMVVDFTDIKKLIHTKLDHQDLNEVFDFNPTAENIAEWVCETVNRYIFDDNQYPFGTYCSQVEIQESEGNKAWYYLPDEVINELLSPF